MERIAFLTFREIDDKGILRYYILQKEFPHNKAVILSQPNHEALCQSVVPGYNLWVVFDGTLRGNFVAAYPDYQKDMQFAMDAMAAFYFSERILKDEKRYSKFKVKQDVSTPAK